jgi:alkylation response protein AidB-like acyl-CoA dehydrogenase
MSAYTAPLKDMKFVLNDLAGLAEVAKLPGYEDATPDTVAAILEEAARFASQVLDPLNRSGDQEGSRWAEGEVRTPKGFREAYRKFAAGGWNALPFEPDWGGQGLPKLVATPVDEMWTSANMSFSLCPLLTQGAVHALALRGAERLQKTYIPKMVTGEWTGTMNLTEPQAGSDLALVKTRAVREVDHYRISGQKIFITYGEHDLTKQIVHLVLARTPDAPEGTKGISLFVVPKFLVKPDGSLGERNGARCASLEHKLGIHASPTCVMAYGEEDGAVGWLVGEENRGIEYMFTMMNNARLGVGLQGLAIGERAYQQARAFAQERVQMRDAVKGGAEPVAIIAHPDVRRTALVGVGPPERARPDRTVVVLGAHGQDAANGVVELRTPNHIRLDPVEAFRVTFSTVSPQQVLRVVLTPAAEQELFVDGAEVILAGTRVVDTQGVQ